ncbi:MAG: hypothetical protein KGO49_09000 [Gammaproteobacteria bacterium]|nr:hypothetical protein [Gammaproteobacteria bacterium]
MKEETYNKLLIRLAILAPLLLIALSKWQYSLNDWYIPLNKDTKSYFSENLAQDVRILPDLRQGHDVTLFFISDTNCPCTRAALNILRTAIDQTSRKDLHLIVVDINDQIAQSSAWMRVLQQIPATPTLLVIEGHRLVYGGPVNSGSMCSANILKILGLSVLQSTPQKPVINWLQAGCYCPLKRTISKTLST